MSTNEVTKTTKAKEKSSIQDASSAVKSTFTNLVRNTALGWRNINAYNASRLWV